MANHSIEDAEKNSKAVEAESLGILGLGAVLIGGMVKSSMEQKAAQKAEQKIRDEISAIDAKIADFDRQSALYRWLNESERDNLVRLRNEKYKALRKGGK